MTYVRSPSAQGNRKIAPPVPTDYPSWLSKDQAYYFMCNDLLHDADTHASLEWVDNFAYDSEMLHCTLDSDGLSSGPHISDGNTTLGIPRTPGDPYRPYGNRLRWSQAGIGRFPKPVWTDYGGNNTPVDHINLNGPDDKIVFYWHKSGDCWLWIGSSALGAGEEVNGLMVTDGSPNNNQLWTSANYLVGPFPHDHTTTTAKLRFGTSKVPRGSNTQSGSRKTVSFDHTFSKGRTYLGPIFWNDGFDCSFSLPTAKNRQNMTGGMGPQVSIRRSSGGAFSASIDHAEEIVSNVWGSIPVMLMRPKIDGLTGKHFPRPAVRRRWSQFEGRIVSGTGRTEDPVEIDRAYPFVDLSATPRDPAAYGVVAGLRAEDVDDGRISVNSVGEGAMWVCQPAAAGMLPAGTLIQSSGIWGLGEGQPEAGVRSYTVAKTVGDVRDFPGVCDTVTGLLRPPVDRSWETAALKGVADQWDVDCAAPDLAARLGEYVEEVPESSADRIAAAAAAGSGPCRPHDDLRAHHGPVGGERDGPGRLRAGDLHDVIDDDAIFRPY